MSGARGDAAPALPQGATTVPAEGHEGRQDPGVREVGLGSLIGRQDLAWAGAVALVAMATALLLRSALVPTDPWHYVQGALDFPDGTWRPAGLSRWGYLLPIIPFARLWGDATATYYVIPVLSTGLLAAVLFLLGTRFAGRVAGVLGTVLALSAPLVLVNLTRGYTDLTATALLGAAILLVTLAEDAARAASDAGRPWGWRVPALLLAAGFTTGWSVEVRETAVLVWPVIAWVLWRIGRIGRPWVTLAWFAPPVLAWLVLDVVLCAVVYDDPLLKLRVITGADISTSEVTSDAGYVGQSRWWYATAIARSLLAISGGPALLTVLAVGLVGGLLLSAHVGRLWAWGVLALVPVWLQGGVLDPAHPSVRLDVARYWLAFLVPLVLTAACVVVIAVRRSTGRVRLAALVGAGALAVAMLVPAARFAATYPGLAPNGGLAMAELRDHLEQTDELAGRRVWADWGTQRILPAYQTGPFGDPRWEAAGFRSLNRMLREPPVPPARWPQPGEYVLLYSTEDRTCWHCRRALAPAEAAFGPFPGDGWEPVFTSTAGNLVLYRLGPDVQWPEARPGAGAGPSGSDGSEEGDEGAGLAVGAADDAGPEPDWP